MDDDNQITQIMVGDHLGQVKRILLPSNEISTLPGCATPTSSNPVVSIERIGESSKHLIANKNGELYIYNHAKDETIQQGIVDDNVIQAIPLDDNVLSIYDKRVTINNEELFKFKRGEAKSAKVFDNKLYSVGRIMPLVIHDIETKAKLFDAEPPEKDWLGIRPDCFVAGVEFVANGKVVTCSKSDSVIRVYDPIQKRTKPVITINLDQNAFNEHAEAGRFVSIASNGDRTIVTGSNVGQIIGIDLRFYKQKLKHKIVGSFKGARGATIKDLRIVSDETSFKVISCCLDRYLRIHSCGSNFGSRFRQLEGHFYMKTKPLCCSPI